MTRKIATLPRLSENMGERKKSPRYRPAPWGDRELGEMIEAGHSPTRAKRLERKARSLVAALLVALSLFFGAGGFLHHAHQAGEIGWCESCNDRGEG